MKWPLVVLLAAVSASPQDWADAPHSWTRFKPGTSKKTRMTVFGPTVEYVHTLKEVTDKEVVFELVTLSIPTQERKESVLRLSLFKLGGEKIAEEALKFKEVEYKCRVHKATYELAGMKTEAKYWLADGIAFPLKTVESGKGEQAWMNLETESLLVSLDEELTVAGKKLKCAKYAGTVKGAQCGTVTQWMCADVPGGLVRSETELGAEGAKAKMKMVMETIEFEVKK